MYHFPGFLLEFCFDNPEDFRKGKIEV